MEQKIGHEVIKGLLAKYWQAETTVEEEKVLAAYFGGADVAPEWEELRPIFAFFEEEAQVVMPAGRVVDMRVYPVRFAAVAAVIFCLGVSLFLVILSSRTSPGSGVAGRVGSGRIGENGKAEEVGSRGTGGITDTYSDPKQALTAIRRALLVASVNMNKGKKITQKNMNRLTNSWQAATGNGSLSQ